MHEKGGWSSDTYQRWIDFAHDQALLRSTQGERVRADAVEMAYFNYGRGLARDRSSARPSESGAAL